MSTSRRWAGILGSSILLVVSGYALGIGALHLGLPSFAAAAFLLPFSLRVPPSRAAVAAPMALVSPRHALRAEIARSRRNNRPFTVIRLPFAVSPSTSAPKRRRPPMLDAAVLRSAVRIVDHVWREEDGLYVLLAESDMEQVSLFLARLEGRLSRTLQLDARVAIYPHDGPTEKAILDRLRGTDPSASRPSSKGSSTAWSDEVAPQQPPLAS